MIISLNSAHFDRKAAVSIEISLFYPKFWIFMPKIQIPGMNEAIFDRSTDFLIDRAVKSKNRHFHQKNPEHWIKKHYLDEIGTTGRARPPPRAFANPRRSVAKQRIPTTKQGERP